MNPAGPSLAPPLTYNQQQLWFLEEMHPGSSTYNIPEASKLRGVLDVAALRAAINDVVARHDILRTTFPSVGGRPVQHIHGFFPLTLEIEDLRARPESGRVAQANTIVAEEALLPFDLARGPLFRCRLLRLADDEHWLLTTAHHIITDGWSAEIVRQEISACYRARRGGQVPALAPLAIQFADYAARQQSELARTLPEHLEYWRRQMAGAPEVIELPADRARPLVSSRKGEQRSLAMPDSLWDRLHALSRAEGATLFMTLVAAVQVLLSRYTGLTDLVIGTPTTGRDSAETAELVGYFVNVLPLRGDLSGDPDFREILQRVKRTTLDAITHQDIPFERLVHALRPGRSASYNPLFQVVMVLEPKQSTLWTLDGLEITAVHQALPSAKFDLTILCKRDAKGMHILFEYSVDLFSAATVDRMLGHLGTLLTSIVDRPDARVSELELMEPAERRQVLESWNPASVPAPPTQCLHERVETQAALNPAACAVSGAGTSLTYGELNERANQLAHLLREQGVGPDVLVGVCLDRTPALLVALLGILKAGGAYVPLDPVYPRSRLEVLLEDANLTLIVAEKAISERLPPHRAMVICIDTDVALLAAQPRHNPANVTRPDHLAYVIYTSGSTGRPKGSLITHANVVRLFTSTEAWFHFDHRDVWTLFHSFAFDFSVWEIWGALLYGGRVVVVPYLVSRSPEDFLHLLEHERVTVLNQTPSAFRQLIVAEATRPSASLALRHVIFGGEALEMSTLRPWFDRHGDERPRLVNMYGITETTVHVTYRPLRRADLTAGSVIGEPIPDLQLYLLDAGRRPVPIGVPGEIYVGGAGVARGYLQRPDLTAERFLDDPFRPVSGAKLYRSGDLARRLESGELVYLGRIDDQVKIRGFRIEPGEIEAVLGEHPSVQEGVVVVRTAPNGSRRLVAYVVGGSAGGISTDVLRRHLRQKLPEHMVPAAIVILDRLPLTAHGKIDRAALPEPATSAAETAGEYVAPGSEIEQRIALVWREVLHIERVGIRDNFFDLGGNSLSLVEVRNRLRTCLSGDVSVMMLFQYPTIEAFARHVGLRPTPPPADDAIARRAQQQLRVVRARAGTAGRPFRP